MSRDLLVQSTYEEILRATYERTQRVLTDADYKHATHSNNDGEVLNMHGIALRKREKRMNSEQKPSIGRVVHYQRYGSPGGEHKAEPSPAVITAVLDAETKRCQLFVMNPNGLYFNDTPYADEPTPGHWNWPPRV